MRSGMYGRVRSGVVPRVTAEKLLIDQWLAIDAAAADGARVPQWVGRLNGMPASQATAARQPRFYGGVVGEPAMLFAGSLLNTPAFVAPPDITVFAKVLFSTAPTSANNSTIWCQDSGSNTRSWHSGVSSTKSARFVSFNAGVTGVAAELAGTIGLNAWQLIEGSRDGDTAAAGTMIAGCNGVNTDPVATGAVYNGAVALSIGARGAYIEQMNGYISELRVYGDKLSEQLKARIRLEMGFQS